MLTGAHVQITSSNASADNAFLHDILGLGGVDAGEGFLIFGLPPSDLAIHEADAASSGKTEMYLICDDVHDFVADMQQRAIVCEPVAERGWGSVTSVVLPSGIKLGVYQAHHARPVGKKKTAKALRATVHVVRKATKKAARAAKKAAKKATKATKKVTKATKKAKRA